MDPKWSPWMPDCQLSAISYFPSGPFFSVFHCLKMGQLRRPVFQPSLQLLVSLEDYLTLFEVVFLGKNDSYQ